MSNSDDESRGGRDERAAARGAERTAPREARRAVVAAHGELAAGLVSAVAQITGRDAALVALSNRGLPGSSLEGLLRAEVEGGARVIFTDLPGGSWTLAARRVMRGRDDLLLVTGVNLAALLDFVMQPDATPEGAARAAEKGKSAIAVTGAARGH